jgi:large subunit ribosomal protein L20
MARVKRGTTAHKRRKNVLNQAKGFRWGRKDKYRLAKDALQHAWRYSYRDRKTKKRNFRQLWQIKINSSCRKEEISYSRFIKMLKDKNIEIDRKILSQLAQEKPAVFSQIIEQVKI